MTLIFGEDGQEISTVAAAVGSKSPARGKAAAAAAKKGSVYDLEPDADEFSGK